MGPIFFLGGSCILGLGLFRVSVSIGDRGMEFFSVHLGLGFGLALSNLFPFFLEGGALGM